MAPESMVHALKQIQEALAKNGRLLDIHPTGQPPPIFVRLDAERHLVGWVKEAGDYAKYLWADDALAEAVQRGWFRVAAREQVIFATYASNLDALQDHLQQNWSSALIEDLVAMQIESQFSHLANEKEIIIEEQIWMSRLVPVT